MSCLFPGLNTSGEISRTLRSFEDSTFWSIEGLASEDPDTWANVLNTSRQPAMYKYRY